MAIISARDASASENITNLLASIAGVKLEAIPCPQLAVVRILIMKFVKIMLYEYLNTWKIPKTQ